MSLFQILFCFVYNTVNFVSLLRVLLLFTRRSTLQVCFRFCFVHKIVNLCKFVSDFVLFCFCLLDGQLCEFVSDFVLFCIQHGQLREFTSGFVVVYKTVNFASLFQILFCSQDCEPLQVCFRFCFVLFLFTRRSTL